MKKEPELIEPPGPSNAFVRVLQIHGKGEVCNLMADAMRECIEAVTLTGKPAAATLKVKFLPAAKGAYAIEFAPVAVKLPQAEAVRSLWYGDDEHNLHREDPKQKDLQFKTVPAATPGMEPRTAVNN